MSAVLLLALPVSTAYGSGGTGRVNCKQHPEAPECDVDVAVPGDLGGGNGGRGGGGDGSNGSGSDEDDGCVWERVDPPPGAAPHGQKGGWYSRTCTSADGTQGFGAAPVWVADAAAPDPGTVARSARAKLRLPVPVIRTNPDASRTQVLVTVPVWLWVDDASWGSRSATASVPGMSVTATATPVRVAWTFGDGGSRTWGHCTAWAEGTDPSKPSPTCGHTYDRPGTRTLTATVTWTVRWAGGGQAGTGPNLTTTAQATVHVAEAPALNTGWR